MDLQAARDLFTVRFGEVVYLDDFIDAYMRGHPLFDCILALCKAEQFEWHDANARSRRLIAMEVACSGPAATK